MFSSAPHLGSRRSSATYLDVNASTVIEGATPHKLVSLLYQSVASDIAAARGAMSRNDIGGKGRAIAHAVRIIEEGLLAPLDVTAGGALALNLRDLYEYMVRRMTLANLKNDDAALAECAQLIEVVREGWDAIADRVHVPARAAA